MTDGWQRAQREADLILHVKEGVPLFLNRIPADEFLMGERGQDPDEEPVHQVRFEQPFYMGVFPVTQELFAVFTRETGLKHKNHFSGDPLLPAESMDWEAARAFCDWVNGLKSVRDPDLPERERIPDGYVADLPTEAEWEYACRAGTDTEYHEGDGEGALEAAGWFNKNNDGKTHPVGEKKANLFGLHDMHGNVDEWCLDGWDADAYKTRVDGVTDPLVWSEGNPYRVGRGGSWCSWAGGCRSALRDWWTPDYRYGFQGFRLGLFPGPLRVKQLAETEERVAEPASSEAKDPR